MENVQSTGQTIPSLSQASELASLPTEQQRKVVQAIEAGKGLKATSVREVKQIVKRVKSGAAPKVAVVAVHTPRKSQNRVTIHPTTYVLTLHLNGDSLAVELADIGALNRLRGICEAAGEEELRRQLTATILQLTRPQPSP